MQLTDADRVRCAIFMFRDDARVWWQGARSAMDMTTLTWNRFKDMFYEKYFTVSTRTKLAKEFLELRQGSMSIAEYVKKFESERYLVPMISENAAEELKHFMEGQNASIRRDKPENFAKDCPQSKEPIKGKVFAMTHDHVDPDSTIVTSMIHIAELPAFVLIDTRATHFFMSVSFMKKLGILPDESISGFCVWLPLGEELKISCVVRNCKIQMQSQELCADFIVLEMVDFDAIFGMDWLAHHEAIIDCKRRTVSLKVQNGKPFVFHVVSKRRTLGMISEGTTWKLLSNGCIGFLASLTGDQEKQRPKLKEVKW
ncbi:uncharacterized protein [Henckelia pumila]|uniref:uncharacterized protein n=1 Tax=Henckelia pumila TaxID=405737 RepID=UPI003C6E411D